ncbi:MAG: DUF4270 family protein, partial [Flavobacteriales bacterium]
MPLLTPKLDQKNILIFCLLGLFILSSCKKEENNIGKNLIDINNSTSFFTDTLSTSTTFHLVDTVETLNKNFVVMGAINDETFGKKEAHLYSQLLLSQNNIEFEPGTQFDSIVLLMPYAAYYGDTTSSQSISIYEVAETIDTIKKFSHENYTLLGDAIASKQFTPQVYVSDEDGGQISNTLRVKLASEFGQKIMDKSGELELENDDNFSNYIKGLAIKFDNNHAGQEGALFRFDYLSTKVRLYYTLDGESKDLDFVFTASANRLNEYVNHYETAPLQASLNQENSAQLFLQGLAGVEVVIDFPHIEQFLESVAQDGEKIFINRALLQLHRETDTLSQFPSPIVCLLNEYRSPKDGSSSEKEYYSILGHSDIGG